MLAKIFSVLAVLLFSFSSQGFSLSVYESDFNLVDVFSPSTSLKSTKAIFFQPMEGPALGFSTL